jgi:hypothetical protein
MRILMSLGYAGVCAVLAGAGVFLAGFGIATMLGQEAGAALGMLVPMVATPLAALAGAFWGFRRGWRRDTTA